MYPTYQAIHGNLTLNAMHGDLTFNAQMPMNPRWIIKSHHHPSQLDGNNKEVTRQNLLGRVSTETKQTSKIF